MVLRKRRERVERRKRAGDEEASGESTAEEPTPDGTQSAASSITAAGAFAAGDLASSDLAARAEELSSTLAERVVESMPVESMPVEDVVTGGVTSRVTEEVAGSEGVEDGSSVSSTPVVGGGVSSVRDSWMDSTAPQDGDATDTGRDVATDYLVGTGRYSEDEVGSMSDDEVGDALNDEALRELVGYDGPVSGETAAGWAAAENEAAMREMAQEHLIAAGWDRETVESWDDATLQAAIAAEAEAALHGAEGIGDGSGSGEGTTSLNLADRGHTAEDGEETSTSTSDASAESSEGDGDGSDDGGDDDDDDDGDDDDDDGEPAETTETTGDDQGDGEESGDSAGTVESSTPTPDQVDEDPLARAAFMESEAAAGQRALDERAIEAGRTGGLTSGGGDDLAARRAWMESELSAGEHDLASTSVGMAQGGGYTDPADGEPVREGLSDIDFTRLPGAGVIDPVDDSGGGDPVDPLTGEPEAPSGPGIASMLESTLDDDISGSGLEAFQGIGELSDDLAARVDDLDLDL